MAFEPRDKDVFIYRSKVFMHLECFFVEKRHRLRYHQLFLMVSKVGSNQSRHLRQPNAKIFIISELRQFSFSERVNHEDVVPLRRVGIIRQLADVMQRQRLVDLTEALVIPGYRDIHQLVAVSKLAARDGLDAVLLAFEHEIDDSHGVVDVGESQRRDMHSTRLLHQILDGDSAVAQAAI